MAKKDDKLAHHIIARGAGDHRDPEWMSERTTNREVLAWLDEVEAVMLVSDPSRPRDFDPQTAGLFSEFDRAFVGAKRSRLGTIAGDEDTFPCVLTGNEIVTLFYIYSKIARRQRKSMEGADAR